MSTRGREAGSGAPARASSGPPGVRVTGGDFRGRSLKVPTGARPTVGRVREALFSIWRHELDGARFLDLFAGSGAVAIEAAGRGALEVLAIEESVQALKVLGGNLDRTGARPLVTVLRGSLPEALTPLARSRPASFDLAFADPPYRFAEYAFLLTAMAPLLAPEGEVAIEHASRSDLPPSVDGLVRVGKRRYGESTLSIYRSA